MYCRYEPRPIGYCLTFDSAYLYGQMTHESWRLKVSRNPADIFVILESMCQGGGEVHISSAPCLMLDGQLLMQHVNTKGRGLCPTSASLTWTEWGATRPGPPGQQRYGPGPDSREQLADSGASMHCWHAGNIQMFLHDTAHEWSICNKKCSGKKYSVKSIQLKEQTESFEVWSNLSQFFPNCKSW